MKVPYNWLKEFVPTDLPVRVAAERLTMGGLSVSTVRPFSSRQEGIVVGSVVKVLKHPNADRLSLCVVEVGVETYDVVCGALNVHAGMKAPFALPGARLPGGRVIEPAVIRGVASKGMLCSAAEIGAGGDADGIMELPPSAPSGEPFVPKPEDWVLDLEITPNRGDALSVLGVARQFAAILGTKVHLPWPVETSPVNAADEGWEVSIEDREGCGLYTARLIDGIKIGPSPDWMRARLLACGLRPINNVVDVTNYVLMETGHPLHSFDAAKIGGKRIVVRRARHGETMRTLDGEEKKLNPEVLVIADGRQAVAIAGVMGGAGSEITGETKSVLLEAAWFDPVRVRRGARSLEMATESSSRFERGVDPLGVIPASVRATRLIAELAGAKPSGVLMGVEGRLPNPGPVRISFSRARSWLGVNLEPERVEKYCDLIGAGIVRKIGSDEMEVVRPSWRLDLAQAADFYEEFAILYGYDLIPSAMPVFRASSLPVSRKVAVEAAVSEALRASGFSEVMNFSFMKRTDFSLLGLDGAGPDEPGKVALLNPMSEEQEFLRSTLVPGLLRSAAFNMARDSAGVLLFEMGAVFQRAEGAGGDGPVLERRSLGLIAAGAVLKDVHFPGRMMDFADVKGALESVARAMGVDLALNADDAPFFSKGECARVMLGGRCVGKAGVLKGSIAGEYGIPAGAAAAELDMESVVESRPSAGQITVPPRFPAVGLDLALTVAEAVSAGSVEAVIKRAGAPLLESVLVFDVYRGRQIDKGSKSIAFRLSFRSSERTLTEKEAEEAFRRIVEAVERECGAKQRTA